MRGSPAQGVVGIAALVYLFSAGPAHGATLVSYTSNAGVRLEALHSGADRVNVELGGSLVTIRRRANDSPAPVPIVVGTGCGGPGTAGDVITCQIPPNGSRLLTFIGNDGSDRLDATTYPNDVIANGGTGFDDLRGGAGFDLLKGGADNDELRGRGGDDVLEGADGNDFFSDEGGVDIYRGGAGDDRFVASTGPVDADLFEGGAGVDLVTYELRTTMVHARIDARATTGNGFPGSAIARDGGSTPPENDDIKQDVEQLTGGTGDDTLTNFFLDGNAQAVPTGPIRLHGGPGEDFLSGQSPFGTALSLNGGPGTDTLEGSPKSDVLDSQDGEPDIIETCGPGFDFAVIDLRDDDIESLPGPTDCEDYDGGNVREGPNVVFLTRRAHVDDGRVSVRLRCPRVLRGLGCKGTLAAGPNRVRATLGTRTRYRIAAGRTATVVVRLRPADLSALRSPPRPRLRLLSVETGRHGPKTTQRVVPINSNR